MAQILWDFARQIDPDASPGNTISYYNEVAQTFYIKDNTIFTKSGQLSMGQWQNVVYEEIGSVSDPGYSLLDIEHRFNDAVFGSVLYNDEVYFIVYEYRVDIRDLIKEGIVVLQPNNSIVASSIALSDSAAARLKGTNTLFAPGTLAVLKYGVDDVIENAWYELVSDALLYDDIRDSYLTRAKNNVALGLLNSTFDNSTEFTGTLTSIINEVLSIAEITDSTVESSAEETTLNVEASDTLLEGLNKLLKPYNWFVDASLDNTIIIGSNGFIQATMPLTIHTFERNSTVFSRNIDHDIGSVYSKVCVVREGVTPLKLFSAVDTFSWGVPANKTFYKEVPEATSTEDMEAIRDTLVDQLQYSGMSETFTTGFRPLLRIGDGAIVTETGNMNMGGVITDVQHFFGKEQESFTQLVVTYGGTMMSSTPTLDTQYVPRLGHMDRTKRIKTFLESVDRR